MDKSGSSKFAIESFSLRKMNRRIRQAIVSTQKMCEHRKDIPSSCLIYKQYRQPIWRLKYYSAYTDERYKWPKSRRIINLLSDPYREIYRNPVSEDGFLYTLPISSVLRTRPKLSLHDRRPIRSPPLCLRRHSPPRLVVPPPPLRRFHVMQPLRSLTRDHSYLYDTLTGRTNESADLAFRSRLLSRISAYSFTDEEPRSFKHYARVAESMYSTYATKLMQEEAAQQYQRRTRFASRNGDFEIEQPKLMLSSKVAIKSLGESIRRRINKIIPSSYVPQTLNSRVGRPAKPFLPNKILGPGRATSNYRNTNLDRAISNAYTWIPKMSRNHTEPEVLSTNFRPKTFLSSDLTERSCFKSNGITFRRYATSSEMLPVKNDDIALRLRLAFKLSPESMSHLYPNDKLVLNNLGAGGTKKIIRRKNDGEETIEEIIRSTKTYSRQKETQTSTSTTKIPFFFTRTAYKPLTPRRPVEYEHFYPSSLPKSNRAFSLRPLPGSNLKLSASRLAERIKSKLDDDGSDLNLEPSRLLTSANNYSRLYVSHPENLPSSELGQHLKLSLRSSTSKIASLYSSYPANRATSPPMRRKKMHNPLSTRIPEKYLPDAYVPRPGISSALRLGSILHGSS